MQENKQNILESNYYDESETINIREELEKYLVNWKWILTSLILALVLVFIYLRYATPTYRAAASIMIKDNQKSGISTELAAFEDLGIIGGASANNPENEIEILKSRKIIGKVIDTLNLDISYFHEGNVKNVEIYKNLPFELKFSNKKFSLFKKDTLFKIEIIDNNNLKFLDVDGQLIMSTSFNTDINDKLGVFKVVKNSSFNAKENKINSLLIQLKVRDNVIDALRQIIEISPVDRNSSVLQLGFVHSIKQKAEDILNELINQYNLDAITG